MTGALETVQRIDVLSDSVGFKMALKNSLAIRIQMLLGDDLNLPCNGGLNIASVVSHEFFVAPYLNPRFYAAMHASCE